MNRVYNNLLDAIGNTPLVKMNFDSPATVYAKLEYLNPGGSVKDRSALYMIEQAEKQGLLKPGGTIIDASSGNQGIASAMIGALKGYKVIISVFEKISQEKLQTILAYGAEVIKCPATEFLEDPRSYHSQAIALHKATPNSFMPNQYFNLSNPEAHYHSLGAEIWRQTEGKITHFFACAGTSGTISGAGRYLKEKNPNIKVLAVDSVNSFRATKGNPKPYKIEGMGVDFDSPILSNGMSVIDEFLTVTDDHALGMLKTLAQHHALLAGPSSGAAAYVAQEYTKNLGPNDLAVVIFGDSGRAYLTKGFYTQATPALDTVKKQEPSQSIAL
ncbi:MAG: cysteine synthase family protein [Candidatus Dependentiae bacterium]|nr:cysteine synthase family protein [Candidatus Dependentiae bacterium]